MPLTSATVCCGPQKGSAGGPLVHGLIPYPENIQQTKQNKIMQTACAWAPHVGGQGGIGERDTKRSCGYPTFRPIRMRKTVSPPLISARVPRKQWSFRFCLLPESLGSSQQQGYYPQKECFYFQPVLSAETEQGSMKQTQVSRVVKSAHEQEEPRSSGSQEVL